MFARLKYPRIVLLALTLGAGGIDYAAEPVPSEQAQMAVIASNRDSLPKIDDGSST